MNWKRKTRKRLQGMAGAAAFRLMMSLSKRLTRKRIERWSGYLAALAYRCSRRYRNIAIRNLTMAFNGQYGDDQVCKMTREVFRHFCRGAMEFFYLAARDSSAVHEMIELSNIEVVDEALKAGKGIIIITAHFGNWELLARKACLMGYPSTVIARDSDDPSMTGIANRIREGGGYKVLGRDKSIRGALECLKKNELLGILPDQNISNGGVFVDFFGQPAATATGPAAFALRTGAAVIPAFAVRQPDGNYVGTFQTPIKYQRTGDNERDELELTAAITKAIEDIIRQYPTQWLWLHDRWKKARESGKLSV